jgi:transmembrane sensor
MSALDSSSEQNRHAIAATAAGWLARRDRGFTPAEQDAFLQWLATDPRHRAEVARIETSWRALDSLAAWQPADGAAPNPDLLAPAMAARRRWFSRAAYALAGATLAAAAAVAIALWWPAPVVPVAVADKAPVVAGVRVLPRPEAQALADGSVAEVKHGGRLEVAFDAAERRVRLEEGEVHLTVAREKERPFVVEAGGVTVRAVGTAFSVRLERDQVDVLVTEGRVQIESPAGAAVPVARGERARVGADLRPVVAAEKPEAIERDLAWRAVRLEFEGLPLTAVVTEFNLRNKLQFAIGDAAAGRVKVAGTFQADKPEAFARLLEAGFGIAVERRPAGAWLLHTASSATRKDGGVPR